MRVVLSEAAHAEEPVQSAGELVAVNKAQFAHTQGQVAIGVRLTLVDQHAARAVHGLDGIVLLVDDGGVHIVLVVVPVAAALPELAVENDRRSHFNIAVLFVDLAPVVYESVFQHHTLGQEEGEAGAGLVHHKETQLAAQLTVVALLRLFKTSQVGIKFLLFEKTGAVNSLEHLAVGVAAPVGAGAVHELDGVALNAAGVVHVGAGAEIGELALPVKADMRVGGQVLYELDLVGLVLLLHEGYGLVAGQLEALKGQLLLAYLAHLGLELFEHLRREGAVGVYIVVKAVVDRRSDSELALRVQALHGLGKDVARCMAIGIAVFLVFKRVFFLVHGRSS